MLFRAWATSTLLTGNFSQAAGHFEAGIAISQQAGDRLGMIISLFDLARLELNTDEFRRAGRRFAEITRLGAEIRLNRRWCYRTSFPGACQHGTGDKPPGEGVHPNKPSITGAASTKTTSTPALPPATSRSWPCCWQTQQRPDISTRLFGLVDQSGLSTHELNTTFELSLYEDARVAGCLPDAGPRTICCCNHRRPVPHDRGSLRMDIQLSTHSAGLNLWAGGEQGRGRRIKNR